MILIIKLSLLISLGTIAYQDLKDRLVWWFLYPLVGALGAYFFVVNSFSAVYLYAVAINLCIVSIVLLVIWAYVKVIMRRRFLKEVFGLGEVLILLALAISFPMLSFIVILVFSMLFSIVVHLITRKFQKIKTVPAAGYISIFLIGIYLVNWLGFYNDLYLL